MISKEEYQTYLSRLVSKEDNENLIKYEKRSKILLRVFAFVALLVVAFVITSIFLVFFAKQKLEFMFYLLPVFVFVMIFLGILSSVTAKNKMDIQKKYKAKIIEFLLKDNKYIYEPAKMIHPNRFKMIYHGRISRYFGEDYLSINIPNDDGSESSNYFCLSDVTAQKITHDKDGNERIETIFRGVFGYVDFPKAFKHTLLINPILDSQVGCFDMQKVKLEDIKFNKNFKVYCDDQVEARYILTPRMMEFLSNLKSKMGGLFLSMHDERLIICFPYKNLFEFKIRKNVNGFYSFYEDMQALLNLVKELQTNNKIFKI